MATVTRKFRSFSTSLTETNLQRILDIFYLLKAKRVNIIFWYSNMLYQSRVVRIGAREAVFFVPDFEPGPSRLVSFYFEVLNQYYHCEISILKFVGDRITVELPEEMEYVRDRKFPRVKFDDLFMRFNILYSSSLFQSKSEEIDLFNRYPYFFEEVTKDSPSIKLIYNMLLTNIKKIGDDFSIVMFHKKKPESYTIFEKTLLKTKKTILIEDVSKMESYIQKMKFSHLGNISDYYKERELEIGEFDAIREIEVLKREDSQNFLVSYLMSPIHIYDHIVGYVRIETNQSHKYWIHNLLAQEFHTVCEIFSYGLTKIRIRESHFNPSAVKTRVLNISNDGLLMEIFDKTLFEYLKKFNRIKILLPIFSRELELYGEIMRSFSKGGGYYMGVHIFNSLPGDNKLLEEYVYENLTYDFF